MNVKGNWKITKLYFLEKENAISYSEIFTRKVLGKCLDVDGSSLSICINEFGKPYLRDYPNIHYNISHKKGAIVCAVSDEPVGVDIERAKKFNKRIAERFFTQNELNYIFTDRRNQDKRFAKIWTRKEAYVKWKGKGMMIPFKSFDVLRLDNNVFINTKYVGGYVISVCQSSHFRYNSR
ncbi:4'-phosphopantetheinyl transferase superfamily protein [Desulfosporosinus sp.]|uniref:4'-phosphopantetheinyl transferase family protein n=1 Tax=Desulfosporosinus sp. TaxID=157907 RepID=UPI00232552B6|nr:4'-phosphopantetheinyl transferase superfamily protein [Desulfosporosinus sp.]MCO5388442.1 4'-phosphopantetheinyl transferase superfamily protein [Desulfosporosinus sp.]MDA8220918.1 4'-phosphopantetheinyl transferase superfamily protein [Desulfitobacterium hafniense]